MHYPRTRALAFLALLIPGSTLAGSLTVAPVAPESLAFARYIASIHRPDPFTESRPVSLVIEASLPASGKEIRAIAVREIGESERSEYTVLQSEGDQAVMQEVIAPYLAELKKIEDLPLSSVIVTPANYKFRFIGKIGTEEYLFRIVPKKKRAGLIRGELWIDSATGAAVMQAGHFVKTSSAGIRRMEMVRDTKLQDGAPRSRVTRVRFETPGAGRGYLTITEFPSAAARTVASAGE